MTTDNNITICVGIRNAEARFLETVMSSIDEYDLFNKGILLSIYDMGDDRFDRVIKSMVSPRYLTYVRDTKPIFSRTVSINMAVRQATTENVFVCDADVSLSKTFPDDFRKHVKKSTLWFPILWSQFEGKPIEIGKKEYGWFRETGFGMMGLTKADFEIVGGYNEKIKKWGGEDQEFFYTAKKKRKLNVVRKRSKLIHHWHPKDTAWHNK